MWTQDAEAAMFAVGEVRAQLPAARRWSWRSWSQVQARRDRLVTELAYPRMIGAAENYLLMYLARVMKPELLRELAPPDPADETTKRLRDAARDFGKLERMWEADLGIVLADLSTWPDFRRSRSIRHVLIHRLGRWEPGLDPKKNLADRISGLGRNPQTYRGQFPLNRSDCNICADLVLELVTAVEVASAGT
jgi:hypothetical protein